MENQTGSMPTAGEHDPLHHTRKMRDRLTEISEHLREDIEKIDEPQAKAMFETSAEVIDAIALAFSHYEKKCEKAWKA